MTDKSEKQMRDLGYIKDKQNMYGSRDSVTLGLGGYITTSSARVLYVYPEVPEKGLAITIDKQHIEENRMIIHNIRMTNKFNSFIMKADMNMGDLIYIIDGKVVGNSKFMCPSPKTVEDYISFEISMEDILEWENMFYNMQLLMDNDLFFNIVIRVKTKNTSGESALRRDGKYSVNIRSGQCWQIPKENAEMFLSGFENNKIKKTLNLLEDYKIELSSEKTVNNFDVKVTERIFMIDNREVKITQRYRPPVIKKIRERTITRPSKTVYMGPKNLAEFEWVTIFNSV